MGYFVKETYSTVNLQKASKLKNCQLEIIKMPQWFHCKRQNTKEHSNKSWKLLLLILLRKLSTTWPILIQGFQFFCSVNSKSKQSEINCFIFWNVQKYYHSITKWAELFFSSLTIHIQYWIEWWSRNCYLIKFIYKINAHGSIM